MSNVLCLLCSLDVIGGTVKHWGLVKRWPICVFHSFFSVCCVLFPPFPLHHQPSYPYSFIIMYLLIPGYFYWLGCGDSNRWEGVLTILVLIIFLKSATCRPSLCPPNPTTSLSSPSIRITVASLCRHDWIVDDCRTGCAVWVLHRGRRR